MLLLPKDVKIKELENFGIPQLRAREFCSSMRKQAKYISYGMSHRKVP